MKRTALRWIAAASALVASLATPGDAKGASRPRYGGELRMEMRAAPRTLDPADPRQLQLISAVFETLVVLNDRGDPQPWLAISWTHDAARKCWVFRPRPNVMLQNGMPWTPTPIEVSDDKPIEQILRDLSRPRNAVVVRTSDGSVTGTGPFRVARWDADKSATLTAHDGYWNGRAFLDTIEIQLGRSVVDQAADFQLGRADVIESQVTELRALKQKSVATFVTEPSAVLALQLETARVPANVRTALAMSIDRTAIHNVILQRQGDVSGALLPQWLTGYAFLFNAERNLPGARQLVPAPVTLAFFYDMLDPIVRPIAQRIEVNAREAGIILRPAPGPADLRLLRLPVTSRDPTIAIDDIAGLLNMIAPQGNAFEAERALLDGNGVIPLVHIPKVWALSPRVKNWPQMADVWIDSSARPEPGARPPDVKPPGVKPPGVKPPGVKPPGGKPPGVKPPGVKP